MGANPERYAVIGGGIVGLAVAWTLTRTRPGAKVTVIEKEPALAAHQTGHNSGVLHSGVYYKPGSLKARTCRAGRSAMEAFCEAEKLPIRRCGKLIVAVEQAELPRLEALHARGRENGVDCELVERARIDELEPAAAGLRALHVRETAVVDFVAVAQRLAERITEAGGEVLTGFGVEALAERPDGVLVGFGERELLANRVVNCAGLQSDRVARLAGQTPEVRILPFRGEYRLLSEPAAAKVRALIYPVPDPQFPFLGVHLTRTLSGQVKCGPNAVLALAREGYQKGAFNRRDLLDALGFVGTHKMLRRHLRQGLAELWRSASPRAFLRSARRLLPSLEEGQLLPGPSGVRAQAIDEQGRLVDDFVLLSSGRLLHVLNAPSPAATASLAIAQEVVRRLGLD